MYKTPTQDLFFQGFIACLWGCLIGLSIYISIFVPQIPPYWMLGIIGGIGLLLITAKRPDLIILCLLFTTSSIINETKVPYIEFSLKIFIFDFFLIALLIGTLSPLLFNPDRRFMFIRSPLDMPLIFFWALALFATYLGFLREVKQPLFLNLLEYSQNPPDFIKLAIPELRVITFYFVIFTITNLFKTKQHAKTLVKGIFLLGFLSALVIILQEIIGVSIPLVTADIDTLNTEGVSFSGVTRIIGFTGEGTLLVAFVVKTITIFIDTKKPSLLDIFLTGTLCLGVLLTFHRNFWIAAGVAFSLMYLIVSSKSRNRVVNWALGITVLITLILCIATFFPENNISKIPLAMLDRFFSFVKSDTYAQDSESTLRARDYENIYAIPQIIKQPIFGLGLGAYYRPRLYQVDPLPEDKIGEYVGYIHNAHLWIMMKGGLLCYIAFMTLSILFIYRSLKYWKIIDDPFLRGVVLGFGLLYIGIHTAALVNPIFMTIWWVPLLAVMMGVNEFIIKLNGENVKPV